MKKTVNVKIISKLTSHPFNLPGKLAGYISRNPEIARKVLEFNPTIGHLKTQNQLNALINEVGDYTATSRDKTLKKQWEQTAENFTDRFNYGFSGPEETIAAMILAGNLLCNDLPDNMLKRKYDSKLLSMRSDFREHSMEERYIPHEYALAYQDLNISANGILKRSIERLVSGEESPQVLRLGSELSNLSVEKIEACRKKYFGENKNFIGRGRWEGFPLLNDAWLPNRKLYSPDKVRMKVRNLTCEQQQETETDDEIFLISYFSKVQDLQELYYQIDNAVKNRNFNDIDLQFETETQVLQTPLKQFNTGDTRDYNFFMGEVDLIQGFGPFHAKLDCYEDDNEEYNAISDVLDNISAYSNYVSKGSGVIASMSGPTPVAAGAAVVSVLANGISVCSKIASAITSIVNFFDSNDYIGSRIYNSESDFVNKPCDNILHHTADLGNYLMSVDESHDGREEVTRVWQYEITHGRDETITSKEYTWLSPGISENYHVQFTMNKETDRIVIADVDHVSVDGDDLGWSEYTIGPMLLVDKRTVYGKIHVGMSGYGEVKDTAWAQGIRILPNPI